MLETIIVSRVTERGPAKTGLVEGPNPHMLQIAATHFARKHSMTDTTPRARIEGIPAGTP